MLPPGGSGGEFFQFIEDVAKNDVGANVEGFASGIAYVGEADAVRGSGQRVLVGEGRFLLVDIYASTGDAALLKGKGEGVDVDDVATCGVDKDGGGIHQSDALAADEVVCVGGEGDVERYDVAIAHEGVEVGVGDAHIFDFLMLGAVVGHHMAAEGKEEPNGGSADGSGADDTDCFAVEFTAEEGATASALEGGVVKRRDTAQYVEHKTDGEFADGDGGVAGGILDFDTVLFAVGEVYVVKAGESHGEVFEVGALA